ncbi:hypothetical protein N7467_002754 [Penicillium canescens]|nr:hypothetical protein N7467_002754 [Penicillium canescens]
MGPWKAVKTRPALDEAVESLKTQLRRRSADLHLTYGRHHTLNVGSPQTSRYRRPGQPPAPEVTRELCSGDTTPVL